MKIKCLKCNCLITECTGWEMCFSWIYLLLTYDRHILYNQLYYLSQDVLWQGAVLFEEPIEAKATGAWWWRVQLQALLNHTRPSGPWGGKYTWCWGLCPFWGGCQNSSWSQHHCVILHRSSGICVCGLVLCRVWRPSAQDWLCLPVQLRHCRRGVGLHHRLELTVVIHHRQEQTLNGPALTVHSNSMLYLSWLLLFINIDNAHYLDIWRNFAKNENSASTFLTLMPFQTLLTLILPFKTKWWFKLPKGQKNTKVIRTTFCFCFFVFALFKDWKHKSLNWPFAKNRPPLHYCCYVRQTMALSRHTSCSHAVKNTSQSKEKTDNEPTNKAE